MFLEYFEDLKRVDGIHCIGFYDKKLNVIERWSSQYLSEKISTSIRQEIAQIFVLSEVYLQPAREFILVTKKEKIFSRNFDRFYLLILAQLKVDIPLIRLITSVSWGKMQKEKKVQKFLRKLPAQSPDFFSEENVDDVEAKYLAQLNNMQKP